MVNKNSFFKLIPLVLGVLVISFVLSFWAVAWTEPQENPPDGNASSPLNVGSSGQTKTGWLATLDSLWVGLEGSGGWPGMLRVLNGALINTNGAPVGLIVAQGNVGIGTTTIPSQRLDVNGQVRATDVCTTAGTCLSTAGGGFSKWTDSGSNIYNNNSGNVGIGITTPTQKLDVSGQVKATEVCIPGKCLSSCLTSAPGSYWTGSGNNIYNNNSGNVGIGTNNPISKLNVVGDVALSGNLIFDVSGGAKIITGIAEPTVSSGAANKSYVDAKALSCTTASANSGNVAPLGGYTVWSVTCNSGYTAVGGGVSCPSGNCGAYWNNVFLGSYPGASSNSWTCSVWNASIFTKNFNCVARCCKI